jgi:hypothetical protein
MSTGSQPSHTIPPEEPFRCEVMPERDAVKVRPVGELDMDTAPVLDAQMRELRDSGFRRLVLDCAVCGSSIRVGCARLRTRTRSVTRAVDHHRDARQHTKGDERGRYRPFRPHGGHRSARPASALKPPERVTLDASTASVRRIARTLLERVALESLSFAAE